MGEGVVMRVFARTILIVALALGVAGCYSVIKMPDIASASVYGPNVSSGPLSQQEVAQLSSWMKAHDAGWRRLVETPPASVTMAIVVHESNGRQSALELFESKEGGAMVYFYAPRPALPLVRYVPPADVAALRTAIDK